jgi:hypothetical protein
VIIPRPATVQPRPGEFVLGPALNLSAGPGAQRPAALLAEQTGGRPRTVVGPAVHLELDRTGGPSEGTGSTSPPTG